MDLLKLCISPELSIREAIKVLDETAKKIILVVKNESLIGVITDGDIRRWILKSGDLDFSVEVVMNADPIYVLEKDINQVKQMMQERRIEAIPVVDQERRVHRVIFWNEVFENKLNYFDKLNIPVVIMAGGKGTRLYPYTKILPKPLIPIGDTPIVERIINRFTEYGCNDFYLTVNYKKEMIKAYFEDLKTAYDIDYVDEDKPLGTGGSLHLLKDKLKETFFVSNCDILIDANYSHILKYHKKNKNLITVITSLKNYTIPYGVIRLNENETIKETQEKPEYNFLVNTGMYVLEPEVLKYIPENEFYHITHLIDYCLENGIKVGTYPVTEQAWLDMGEFHEMERMAKRLGVE